ncbi:MAG: hypothetical protein ACPHRO_14075 [Nannocystaceae bacterium]
MPGEVATSEPDEVAASEPEVVAPSEPEEAAASEPYPEPEDAAVSLPEEIAAPEPYPDNPDPASSAWTRPLVIDPSSSEVDPLSPPTREPRGPSATPDNSQDRRRGGESDRPAAVTPSTSPPRLTRRTLTGARRPKRPSPPRQAPKILTPDDLGSLDDESPSSARIEDLPDIGPLPDLDSL